MRKRGMEGIRADNSDIKSSLHFLCVEKRGMRLPLVFLSEYAC